MSNDLQQVFDRFIFATDEDLTVNTAFKIAAELGVEFDPENYDL